ncbi:TPA: TetR/AcrR family transcriptional regulator [Clostridioides difficile]|uniref:TetR family transcriptional regulator n=1 Tax=Clostridioides difficile TaxID=1496 RepID=UPI00093BB510|nr:TetR/AcrR family transcriptional regulator [Clostridioides difficile]MBY1153598.1 TetR/AcrR family transcriptional regulator [Clostridioides difficile]MCD8683858.1 TetR/AcrR family transcriptional regulator [Clostridioides difficile]HBE8798082.1 TetR/AcrR family transcriptional regulator [Clostridioides difficile]HBE8851560.1 TetR/AcrR family transcriptional regulator [Clostridioides difficile]
MARNKYPEETVNLILEVATKLFIEKGYDHTSLQDIISETKLSKGAIYHHFSSKEEIFEAMYHRIGIENSEFLAKIRDDKKLSGYNKLKAIFKVALTNPNQGIMMTATPNLLENTRFLAMQIRQIYDIVSPDFILPILEEGNRDGSIHTEHPKELAEAMMLLSNVWLNPLIREDSVEEMRRKCIVYGEMFSALGVDLMDEEIIEGYIDSCLQAQKHNK